MTGSQAQLRLDRISISEPTLTLNVAVADLNYAEHISHFLGHLEGQQRLLRRFQYVSLSFAINLRNEDKAVWDDAQQRFLNYRPRYTRVLGQRI